MMNVAYDEAVRTIRSRSPLAPRVAIVLGSGLGAVARTMERAVRIPYTSIPGLIAPSVAGHSGELVLGLASGIPAAVFCGRLHLYEGQDAHAVTLPIRISAALGVRALVATNAAGAINPSFKPGELLLITDHINLTGHNPLVGVTGGDRFIDMSEAYDRGFIEIAEKAAWKTGVAVRKGVYMGVLGPSYETPAEIKMARALGADAVGMSTVLEVIVGRQQGLRVLGISCLTNMAAGVTKKKLDHAEVLAASAQSADAIRDLFTQVLPQIAGGS
jgi:purine-nucleoside phosphorylase